MSLPWSGWETTAASEWTTRYSTPRHSETPTGNGTVLFARHRLLGSQDHRSSVFHRFRQIFRMPQSTPRHPPLKVGFRRKSQDTDTIRVGFISNRSRKPVVASWTAIPSSSSFRPKYHDRFSSIQPLAYLYYYPLALNALNQQVIKPWEQVGPHKYFPDRTTFRHGPIHVNLYPLHTPSGKSWFTIWPLGGTPFLAHKILLLSALHISFNKCIARYMFEQTLL